MYDFCATTVIILLAGLNMGLKGEIEKIVMRCVLHCTAFATKQT